MSWTNTVPELATRPNLLQYLEEHNHRRKQFFRYVEDLISVATCLAGHRRGANVIEYLYQRSAESLRTHWNALNTSEDENDNRVFNEAVGCLRNVFLNALNRVQGELMHESANPHFVVRELPTWLWNRGQPS